MKRLFINKLMLFCSATLIFTFIFSSFMRNNIYAASLMWPVPGYTGLSQGLHGNAIDISAPGGATIVAAMGGTVTHKFTCGQQHLGSNHTCNGFGTGIVISGNDGRIYQYAHMTSNSIPANVYVGATVSTGQVIGAVGTTGNSSGNHLHFGISTGNYLNVSGYNPSPTNGTESYYYSSDTSAPTITFANQSIKFTDDCNAGVFTRIQNPFYQNVQTVGCRLYNESGVLLKNYTETCGLSSSYVNYTCNFISDMGYTLEAGTTYKYQQYAIFNGVEYKDNKIIVVIMAGTRENFYNELKRYMKD